MISEITNWILYSSTHGGGVLNFLLGFINCPLLIAQEHLYDYKP